MASAVRAERSIPERETVLFRLDTDASESGRWESRSVVLTPQALEVRKSDGETVLRLAVRDLAGTAVRETGGGAWIEALTLDGQPVRLGFCKLSGIRAMQAFDAQVRAFLDGGPPPESRDRAEAGSASRAEDHERAEEPVRLSWSDRLRVLVHLARFVAPYKRQMLGLCGILLIAAALEAVSPYLMKPIIDGGVLSSSPAAFAGLIGLLVAAYVLEAVFQVWRGKLGIRLGSLLVGRIREDMFGKLMDLPIRYYERRKTAPFISRIQHDAEFVQEFLALGMTQLFAQFILSCAVLAMMFFLDWRLTLFMLVLAPVCLAVVLALWPKLRSLRNRKWNAEYDLQQYISEALQGVRVIKAFHRGETEKTRFRTLNGIAVGRMKEQAVWSQWMHSGMGLALSLGIALAWFVGGQRVIDGDATLGSVVAFTAYFSMFLGHLESNARAMGWTNAALAAADRILDLLQAEPESEEDGVSVRLPQARGEITVEDVRFGYEQGREVLRNVSLQIRPGEKIGIVGRSGAGKSTLIHLLCRFYDPDAGRICLDGIDLRRLAKEDLRRHVGIVFQETYLFDGTVAENIGYGLPDAAPERIVQAAVQARAHDFISRLPYGYDTMVGERGVQLSGGEKQRISIARTLLLNPSVLILDEATSSVDTETESEIQEALERLSEGRTTVAIAHRLSALRRVDRIFVLDGGTLAETGTHEQLSGRDGVYLRLLRSQESGRPAMEGAR
ncbi:ABC transporter ATP-binding protein [Cohnella caldifontis]|uniref:ABC transporter ATP-binding protein n=1 Tax=Cohnella caldifontis TaxID=3027471 RepID=UPI0023EDB518|nr:ABC transporter ATP-binding protein [Cohnella sp. YIM B05605]